MLLEHLLLLSPVDGAAVVLICLAWWVVGWVIEHPPANFPSVSVLMVDHRFAWMAALEKRENRIFDAQIMGTLREGTSFFASTSILAIGGVLALVGNTETLRGVAIEFTADVPEFVWRLKLLLVTAFLTLAFLKFVWAHRLFGYCAVVMGALGPAGAPDGDMKSRQAAGLNIRAATNFTRGLRAMYFALGALAWLIGPWALVASTFGVCYLLLSREFNSAPREILLGRVTGKLD